MELRDSYGVEGMVYPSKELSCLWAQIPAEKEIDMTVIGAVTQWLSAAEEGDVFIIQGEAGSTFLLVDYALKNKLVPVHAVTRRVSSERKEGDQVIKQQIFEHVCFRRYKYF